MRTELVEAALLSALGKREPSADLLHHTDRGSQYASENYRRRLKDLGIAVSMSRRGDCYDNAVVESFFDTLKTEIGIEVFESRAHARRALFDYIEVFYNRRRRHSALGNISPAAFERLARRAA
jgi:transposase InsO family protein